LCCCGGEPAAGGLEGERDDVAEDGDVGVLFGCETRGRGRVDGDEAGEREVDSCAKEGGADGRRQIWIQNPCVLLLAEFCRVRRGKRTWKVAFLDCL
jgi:hypothetical protein